MTKMPRCKRMIVHQLHVIAWHQLYNHSFSSCSNIFLDINIEDFQDFEDE